MFVTAFAFAETAKAPLDSLLLANDIAIQDNTFVFSVTDGVNPNDPKILVGIYATKYGVSYNELYKVILCESNFNNLARGLAGEIGIAQFMPNTWNRFNQIRETELNIYNVEDQLDMVSWAFQHKLKSNWTCYRKLVTSS